MQSHMITLQQELNTYKSMLAEKQQKNEQLQNKLTKVIASEYIRVLCCLFIQTERSCRDALAQKEMEFARTCKANQETLELAQQQTKMETMATIRRLSGTQASLSSSQKSIFNLRRDINGVVSALNDMNRLFQQEMASAKKKVIPLLSMEYAIICLLGYSRHF